MSQKNSVNNLSRDCYFFKKPIDCRLKVPGSIGVLKPLAVAFLLSSGQSASALPEHMNAQDKTALRSNKDSVEYSVLIEKNESENFDKSQNENHEGISRVAVSDGGSPPIVTVTSIDLELISDRNLRNCISDLMVSQNWHFIEQVKQLSCKNMHINSLAGMEQFSELLFLDVSGNEISTLTDVEALSKLQALNINRNPLNGTLNVSSWHQLQTLKLGNTGIDSITGIEQLAQLTSLDIHNSRFTDLSVFNEVTTLQEFMATGLSVPLFSLMDILKNNTGLIEVNLQGYDLRGMALSLAHWPNLLRLNISGTRIDPGFDTSGADKLEAFIAADNSWKKVPAIDFLSSLKVLDLSENKLIDPIHFTGIKKLEELNLSGNPRLYFSFVDALVRDNPLLKVLKLDDVKIGETFPYYQPSDSPYVSHQFYELSLNKTGLKNLSSLEGYANSLQRLRLSDNEIRSAQGLENLAQLVELDLSNNLLTQLTELNSVALTRLQHLNLSGLRRLGSSAVNDLVAVLNKNPAIENLALSDMNLVDLPDTISFASLKEVRLDNTGLTDLNHLLDNTVLEVLSVRNNPLQSMPVFNQWTRLRELDISENRFSGALNLTGLTQLQTLKLRDTAIETLTGIEQVSTLTVVDIHGTRITDLSVFNGFTHLLEFYATNLNVPVTDVLSVMHNNTGLRVIDLQGYDLSEEYLHLALWPELLRLNVSDTGISSNFYLSSEAPQLQEFYGANNNWIHMFHVDELSSLLVLDLSGNNLVIVGLSGVENLEELNLSGNKMLTLSDLDSDIRRQDSLRLLKLNDIEVGESFPAYSFQQLKELSLNNTGLKNLTSLEFYANSLQRLYLSDNRINSAHGLQNLTNLVELDLSNNPLTQLSELVSTELTRLQVLKLSNLNSLDETAATDIGDVLTNNPVIKELTLTGMDLSELPDSVSFSLLKEARLDNTGLTNLDHFIGNTELEVLSLRGNALQSMPAFNQWTKLRELDISENRFSGALDLTGLTQLQTLRLRDTEIETLTGIDQIRALTVLDIHSTRISDLSVFSGLTQLQEFYATDLNVPVNDVLTVMQNNPGLQVIDLQGYNLSNINLSLSNWPELLRLNVNDTGLLYPPFLWEAPKLQEFYGVNNSWSDSIIIADSISLKVLDLSGNNMDYFRLENVDNLEELNLSGNKLLDFTLFSSDIDDLTNLKILKLDDIEIGEAFPVYGSQYQPRQLKELSLNNTGLKDLSSLDVYAATLKNLSVSENQVSSLEGVQNLINLINLDLSNNPITHLSALNSTAFNQLHGLHLSNLRLLDDTAIQDLAGLLTNNPALERLALNGMDLTDLPASVSFSSLKEARLDNTRLTNLDRLTNNTVLEVLSVQDNHLRSMPAFTQWPELRELDVSGNFLSGTLDLSGLNQLTVLKLGNTLIDSFSGFSQSNNLKILDIHDTRFTDMSVFNQLNSLQEFRATGLEVNGESVLNVMRQNPDLVAIDLHGYDLSDVHLILDDWPNLVSLNISHTGMKNGFSIYNRQKLREVYAAYNGWDNTHDVSNLSSLKVLDLSGNDLYLLDFYDLKGLEELYLSWNKRLSFDRVLNVVGPAIRVLEIDGIEINDTFPDLEYSGTPYKFEKLSLNNTNVGFISTLAFYKDTLTHISAADNDFHSLYDFDKFEKLTYLDVSNNTLTSLDGLTSETVTRLQTLKLAGQNTLNDAAAEDIVKILTHNKKLQVLDISDIDLSELTQTLPLNGVQKLYLNNTNLDDLSVLAASKQLKTLSARENEVQNLPELSNWPNMEQLDLSDNPISGTLDTTGVRYLHTLELGNTRIDNLAGIEQLTELTALDIQGTDLTDLSVLMEINTLQKFWAGNLGVAADTIVDVMYHNPNLTLIDLQGNDLSNTELLIGSWPRLQSLNVSGTEIRYDTSFYLATELEYLYATDNAWQAISSIDNMTSLKLLDLRRNNLRSLGYVYNDNNLEDLKLSGNAQLPFNDVDSLIRKSPRLHTLELDDIDIGSQFPDYSNNYPYGFIKLSLNNTGLHSLASIKNHFYSLSYLSVAENNVGSIDMQREFPELKYFDLSNNPVTDLSWFKNYNIRGLKTLKLMGLTQLEPNAIKDIVDIVELNCCQLRSLYLNDTDLSNLPDTFLFYKISELHLDRTGFALLSSTKANHYLEIFSLSGNELTVLPDLSMSARLHTLDLSHNNLNSLEELNTAHELTRLNLSGNTNMPCDEIDRLINQIGPGLMVETPEHCQLY